MIWLIEIITHQHLTKVFKRKAEIKMYMVIIITYLLWCDTVEWLVFNQISLYCLVYFAVTHLNKMKKNSVEVDCVYIYIYIYIYIYKAHLKVIIMGNRISNLSSNPEWGRLCFISHNCHWERHESVCSFQL